jgi:hypothetical protein
MRAPRAKAMQGHVEYMPISEDMVVNQVSEGFLKRMLGQRSGILVCCCPPELDGREILGILANHSIRLSMQHRFHSEGDTYEGTGAGPKGLTPDVANQLTRAFLSRKPDYRFFERRIDGEVLAQMVQAAMSDGLLATGHIPAASSFIALSKLIELASTSTMLASLLNGIFGLTYINIICPYCKIELPPAEVPSGLLVTGEIDGARLRQFRGTGCPNCMGTGYIAYEILSECLEMNPTLREALLHGAGLNAMKRLGKSTGTTTFLDAAWAFFRAGITTLDEVKRIAAATRLT